MTEEPIEPIRVFFSYSRSDESFKDELEKRLSILQRQGVISSWNDRLIEPGSEWEREIDAQLSTADIILLLVSPDFLNSNYCWDVEVKKAMQRDAAGEARVIPVVLRWTNWEGTPFAKFQALPKDAKPIASWSDRDEAFYDVAQGIRVAVEKLREAQRQTREEKRRAEERARLEAEEHKRQEEKQQAEEKARLEAEGHKRREEEHKAELQQQAEEKARRETRERNRLARLARLKYLAERRVRREAKEHNSKKIGYLLLSGGGIGIVLVAFSFMNKPQPQQSNQPPQSSTASTASQMTAEDFFNRGLEKRKKGDTQGAITDFDQAIKLKPDYSLAYNARGNARSDLGDEQGAITDFDQAIKLKPDNAAIYNNRGNIRSYLGDKQGAIADYDQAIKLKSDYAQTYYNRGNARQALGDNQAAIADFQKARDLYQQQGKTNDYQDALARLKELQP